MRPINKKMSFSKDVPRWIKEVRNHFKTQEICNEVVRIEPCSLLLCCMSLITISQRRCVMIMLKIHTGQHMYQSTTGRLSCVKRSLNVILVPWCTSPIGCVSMWWQCGAEGPIFFDWWPIFFWLFCDESTNKYMAWKWLSRWWGCYQMVRRL